MAIRPIFSPTSNGPSLVETLSIEFDWNPGMAVVQKQKNVFALHDAAGRAGYPNVLEVSTKSNSKLGQRLSAFNLTVTTRLDGEISVESAYQGSKVFERGGPYTDIYSKSPREAKRDERLKSSGKITGFEFEGGDFPKDPPSAFYDWLFLRGMYPHREYLNRLDSFSAFSDIEFNPAKSVNTQARACAVFVSLLRRGWLEEIVNHPGAFLAAYRGARVQPKLI